MNYFHLCEIVEVKNTRILQLINKILNVARLSTGEIISSYLEKGQEVSFRGKEAFLHDNSMHYFNNLFKDNPLFHLRYPCRNEAENSNLWQYDECHFVKFDKH